MSGCRRAIRELAECAIPYGVYLIHKPVLGLVFDFYPHKWLWAETTTERLLVLSALAVTFAVASFSWSFFEKPLLKIGQSMKY